MPKNEKISHVWSWNVSVFMFLNWHVWKNLKTIKILNSWKISTITNYLAAISRHYSASGNQFFLLKLLLIDVESQLVISNLFSNFKISPQIYSVFEKVSRNFIIRNCVSWQIFENEPENVLRRKVFTFSLNCISLIRMPRAYESCLCISLKCLEKSKNLFNNKRPEQCFWYWKLLLLFIETEKKVPVK